MTTENATHEWQRSAIFTGVYDAAEFFGVEATKIIEGSVSRHFFVTLNKEKVEFSGKRRHCYYRIVD